MRIIEPCCYHKQLEGMIDECNKKHTAANFFSYSDWDMCDLLGTLSGYCSGGEMGIVMVRLDVKLIQTIRRILSHVRPDPTNPSDHIADVSKMILISQPASTGATFNQRQEIRSQLGDFIQSGRLVVCEDNVGFRCITVKSKLHSLVIQGSLNTQRSNAMQMFTLTTSPEEYENVAEMLRMKEHTKRIFKQ